MALLVVRGAAVPLSWWQSSGRQPGSLWHCFVICESAFFLKCLLIFIYYLTAWRIAGRPQRAKAAASAAFGHSFLVATPSFVLLVPSFCYCFFT